MYRKPFREISFFAKLGIFKPQHFINFHCKTLGTDITLHTHMLASVKIFRLVGKGRLQRIKINCMKDQGKLYRMKDKLYWMGDKLY